MDYGKYIAMQRAKRKREHKDAAADKAPVKPVRKKSTPVLYEWPMREKNDFGAIEGIDWNDSSMSEHSSYLANQFACEGRKFKLLALPTGTGKTAIAVKAVAELKRETPSLQFIVVASKSIITKGGWQKTINSWNLAHPEEQLDPYMLETYDRFANICDDKKCIVSMVKSAGQDLLIILDEVHNCKNPVSKRSKKLQNLSHWSKLGLSATPFTNNAVMDACSYLVMGGFYRNKTNFMEKNDLVKRLGDYGELLVFDEEGKVIPALWPRYPEFRKELAQTIYQPSVDLRSLDMPNLVTRIEQLGHSESLDSDLRSLYKAYVKRMFDSVTDFRLAAMERICQDDLRLDTLFDIISDTRTVQPLVFYWHVSTLQFLEQRLSEASVEYQIVSGSNPISEVDFDKDTVVLMQYQAASEGVEAKLSNTSIFYENQYSYVKLVQAQGRNVRRGMDHDVIQYHLLADCAFDREVFERVRKAEELSDAMLNEIAVETLSLSS